MVIEIGKPKKRKKYTFGMFISCAYLSGLRDAQTGKTLFLGVL
jgi:hypothetical protein